MPVCRDDVCVFFFFFQAEDGIRDLTVTGVQTCALPICSVEHVRTLSGFADTLSGRRLIFSFLSNNQAGKNHEAADALTGLCVAMLEEFNSAPPPPKRAPGRKRAH